MGWLSHDSASIGPEEFQIRMVPGGLTSRMPMILSIDGSQLEHLVFEND